MKMILAVLKLTKWVYIIPMIILLFLLGSLWHNHLQTEKSQLPQVQKTVAVSGINEPIQPIPLEINLDEKKVELGKKLFNDPQLSHNNTISCASCHNISTAGVDRLVRSLGINGAVMLRNTPTVFNSGFNFRQGLDGGAATLSENVELTILNPNIMDSNWSEIISKLIKSPDYVKGFAQIYPNSITGENIKDAISTFEQSLYTPNSRFDKFLRGQSNALTNEEKAGYKIFKEYGCVSCHQGVNIGGNLFQKFGAIEDYFAEHGGANKADLGRLNITGDEADRYVFKVPSLRNVSLTYPYLHNGAAKTLEEAIDIMTEYQLGHRLSQKDRKLIVRFLRTLKGEYQGHPL